MFGLRHGSCDEGRRAARHGWHRHHGGGWGGGRPGMGGRHMPRGGRMLASGDLRLIALALIAEQPRRGYEIIDVLEEKSAGWYSPGPWNVYPTLTCLEEAGHVTGDVQGANKRYTITDEGRARLVENHNFVDAVLERISAVGDRTACMRRHLGADGEDGRVRRLPLRVRAALENLRDVAAQRLAEDGDTDVTIVEILARAATEIGRG